MIEDQFSAMPAGKGNGQGGERRQHETIGQDLLGVVKPQSRISTGDGDQHHGSDGVVPTGDADANARHSEQFERSHDGGEHTQQEGGASRPNADLHPERIGAPPVEDVHAQGRDDEGDGEMYQHGVQGMAGDRDGRTDVLFGHRADMGIWVVRVRFGRRFFLLDRLFLCLARCVAHWKSPLVKTLLIGATPLALAGCSGALSALDPAGPRAANLATLWWVMLIGSTLLFALVMVLLLLAYKRSDWISRVTPGQWIIGGGLVLPVPILVLLTGTALVLGEQLLPHGDAPVRVEGEARQWEWTFSYPDTAMAPTGTLHIPAGQPVDIVVTARDVIHSLWVPRLGGKIDAIPGHTNVIRLEADEPGIYWGQCAEYCGEGHDGMQFRVEAHDPAAFAALMEGRDQ